MNEYKKDGRYSTNLEYCGYSIPMYCVRFCDKLIGVAGDQFKADHIVETHYKKRICQDELNYLDLTNP